MPAPLSRGTLARFLWLSLGLHLMLLGFGQSANHATLPYLGQPVINVEIQNTNPAARSHAKHTPASPLDEKHAHYLHSATRDEKSIPDTSPSFSAVENLRQPEQAAATAWEAKLRNQLLGQLQTHLSRYLVYPPLARQRGWQGTVLLGLRVEPNGHLEKIYVERSSGYAVLDHSALNSLNRIGHLAEASAWLNGRGMDMQLPVIYRLLDN